MTSQTWQGILWKHVVWLILPTQGPKLRQEPVQDDKTLPFAITGDSAILFIGGGAWKDEWNVRPPQNLTPPRELNFLSELANQTSSPVVLIEQVPFQPILDGRFEDAIIAETFRRYLMDEGDDWPLLMPMVKSAVRCMDLAQEQLKERFQVSIERFTVTGASKRGWTTWLTGAVDERVDAIAPIVIDMLNMPKQMQHQIDSWGKYSEEIGDYTELELQKHLSSPRGQMLQQIVDPYSYREILDLPKLLIFATNDRYWTLDACNMYWDELIGPKNLLYVPNNGHGIQDVARLVGSLSAFHLARKANQILPEPQWSFKRDSETRGVYKVTPNAEVKNCVLWLARSETLDFRGAVWISIPMFVQNDSEYSVNFDMKSDTNVAFFAEVVTKDSHSAYLSTNITIVPALKK
jgi:PhoPQ-activated pathogenicity-related protein